MPFCVGLIRKHDSGVLTPTPTPKQLCLGFCFPLTCQGVCLPGRHSDELCTVRLLPGTLPLCAGPGPRRPVVPSLLSPLKGRRAHGSPGRPRQPKWRAAVWESALSARLEIALLGGSSPPGSLRPLEGSVSWGLRAPLLRAATQRGAHYSLWIRRADPRAWGVTCGVDGG